MMKKILRTILRAIPVVLVLVFCLSVTAMAYSGSESVTLKTTQNEATSGSLSCHHAKVSATNSASSQHNVSAALQLSSGHKETAATGGCPPNMHSRSALRPACLRHRNSGGGARFRFFRSADRPSDNGRHSFRRTPAGFRAPTRASARKAPGDCRRHHAESAHRHNRSAGHAVPYHRTER